MSLLCSNQFGDLDDRARSITKTNLENRLRVLLVDLKATKDQDWMEALFFFGENPSDRSFKFETIVIPSSEN